VKCKQLKTIENFTVILNIYYCLLNAQNAFFNLLSMLQVKENARWKNKRDRKRKSDIIKICNNIFM